MKHLTRTRLIERRSFLKAVGASFAATLFPSAADALAGAEALYASAFQDRSGAFGVALLSEDGTVLHRYRLPARGHDLAVQPNGAALVAFARRPGTFAVVFDLTRAHPPKVIATANGRHFYGHGVFSANGRLLYATENDFEAARGVIGVYDATDAFQRIGEFDTFGTGPHELALLPDARTLVIANGGIETHPDYPRAKLNLSTMQPSLTFVDSTTGDRLVQLKLTPDLHKLSIRHLAFDATGQVWFACQNEGDRTKMLPLIGRASLRSGKFRLVDLPDQHTRSLRGYVGSIKSNHKTGTIAIASPRGGVALEFDPAAGQILRSFETADVCGIAPVGKGFAFSSGDGLFAGRQHGIGFDNHIAGLS